ncbi:MAG TPA: Hsp20/alpha crystallin family protein [Nitrososphaeraceae archaeon]|jgi:HSP20 family molecular chaperone IbpA
MNSGKSEITKRKALFPTAFDDIFEGFRRDMEDAFYLPSQFLDRRREISSDFDTRFPLCDMEDLGDKYEINLVTPGIPKDKISVKAGTDYIDISGEQEKK